MSADGNDDRTALLPDRPAEPAPGDPRLILFPLHCYRKALEVHCAGCARCMTVVEKYYDGKGAWPIPIGADFCLEGRALLQRLIPYL